MIHAYAWGMSGRCNSCGYLCGHCNGVQCGFRGQVKICGCAQKVSVCQKSASEIKMVRKIDDTCMISCVSNKYESTYVLNVNSFGCLLSGERSAGVCCLFLAPRRRRRTQRYARRGKEKGPAFAGPLSAGEICRACRRHPILPSVTPRSVRSGTCGKDGIQPPCGGAG